MHIVSMTRLSISKAIDEHPKRDEIVARLYDHNYTIMDLHREYGIHRATLTKARKIAEKYAGAIVAATIQQAPETVARLPQGRELSVERLSSDLDGLLDKLRGLQTNPALSPQQIMQAVEGERKVVATLIQMAQLMIDHGEQRKAARDLERVRKALAMTFRRLPEAREIYREEYERMRGVTDDEPTEST